MELIDRSSTYLRYNQAQKELVYLCPIFRSCRTLLDIGCGLAITSIELALLHRTKLFLMDGYKGIKRTGFSSSIVPYHKMERTRELAELNKVEFEILHPDPTVEIGLVDGIMSLQSWGHHYSIQRYLPLALRSLVKGGPLVIDIRRGIDGLGELTHLGRFEVIGKLDETSRMERYHLRRT